VASLELTDDDLERLAEQLAPLLAVAIAGEATTAAGQDDRWLRTAEAATYLGISKSELHRRAAAGAIPHEQDGPGAALFFKRAELDGWRRGEGRR
jgi:excisionase family DNA binding protein